MERWNGSKLQNGLVVLLLRCEINSNSLIRMLIGSWEQHGESDLTSPRRFLDLAHRVDHLPGSCNHPAVTQSPGPISRLWSMVWNQVSVSFNGIVFQGDHFVYVNMR